MTDEPMPDGPAPPPARPRRRWRRAALVAAGLLGAAQLVPLDRSNPPVTADFDGPPAVEAVLRASCYDCHSNETVWSWTAYVAPASWLVVRDVHRARDEFNLSEWDRLDADDRAELPAKMVEEVEEGAMPLPPYLLIHPEARVSDADLATLRAWAGTTARPDDARPDDARDADRRDDDRRDRRGRDDDRRDDRRND